MDVFELPIRAAIGWLDERFEIPRLPKGAHVRQPDHQNERYGYETEVGLLIRSGVWAALSSSAQRLVPVLLEFAEPKHSREERWLRMSYRALSRYSGIGSPNAVRQALGEIQEIGWLELTTSDRGSKRIVRETGAYRVTPFSDAVYELANAVAGEMRAAVALERQLREEQRTRRSSQLRTEKETSSARVGT